MPSNYKRMGDLIRLVDVRNKDLKVKTLLGLSISKQFIPSVANTIGTNMRNYKIIKKNQFACSVMQVRRDKKMPVALLQDIDEAIISQAYPVFEVIDETEILPEYLMMWMSRSEFDRHACFLAVGGVRGSLEWEDFCNMELPVPLIDKQRAIVKEYNTITNRIKLNEQLNQKLEETAQALYRHWFVDFEFPDEEGKAYRSNGGKMVWCEELEKEIPKGWKIVYLNELFVLQRGFDLPTRKRKIGNYPIYASTGISSYHSEYKVELYGVVTGRSGSLGEVFFIDEKFWPLNTTLWIKEFKKCNPSYAYFYLKNMNILEFQSGSAVPTLNRNHIHTHKTYVPFMEVQNQFQNIFLKMKAKESLLEKQKKILHNFGNILLSKMSKEEIPKLSNV